MKLLQFLDLHGGALPFTSAVLPPLEIWHITRNFHLNPDFKVAPIPGGLQTRSSSKVCRHGGAVPGDWATTQNNLGNALADLETRAPTGRRPGRKPRRAIRCYTSARAVKPFFELLRTPPKYVCVLGREHPGLAASDHVTTVATGFFCGRPRPCRIAICRSIRG